MHNRVVGLCLLAAHGRVLSVHVLFGGDSDDPVPTKPTSVLVNHRHVHLESLFLHTQVLPRGRQRMLCHPRVFLSRAIRHLPRPASAL